MDSSYLALSYWQLVLAALLVLLNGLISYLLRLGLGKTLTVAALRTVVQLLLVGLILQWVFAAKRWYWVVLMMVVMTVVAGATASRRPKYRYPGLWLTSLSSIWVSSWIVLTYAVFGVLRFHPWYDPQYLVPILGMMLGNSLSGISLALDRFNDDILGHREQVETLLALGGTRWEAARASLADAVRVGMIPMTNAMMVAGLVSLPGMMTGQLLAGVSPVEAVKYQIVIMFLLATTTLLGTLGVTVLGFRRLFNTRHQLVTPRGLVRT